MTVLDAPVAPTTELLCRLAASSQGRRPTSLRNTK